MAALDAWRRTAGVVFELEQPAALAGPPPRPDQQTVMRYGSVPGVPKPISRLIMGTVGFSPRDLALACTMFDHFAALGGNAFDSAHQYGRGDCERVLGQWMALRGNREDIVVVTKGAREDAELGRGLRVNSAAITSDLADSLERLHTDYVDVYMLHCDDTRVDVGPIVECLNEHHAAGRIRAFGGSNWSIERIQAANEYAYAHGLVPFVVGSPHLSLAVWNEPPWFGCLAAIGEERTWYRQHQFPLLPWSSQAQGFFTGRYASDDRSNSEMVRTWYSEANFKRLERARSWVHAKGSPPRRSRWHTCCASRFPRLR